MAEHELKTWPEPYGAIVRGEKTRVVSDTLPRTLVADPPWPISWAAPGKTRSNGRKEQRVNTPSGLTYKTMTVDEIAAFPIPTMAADAWLLLWTLDRFLLDGSAARVARAWGFEPKRFLVWRKSGFALGTFPRPQHEIAVVCTRGKPQHLARNVGSVQSWPLVYERRGQTVGRRHSAKPDDFYALVERTVPGPYVELFARKRRPGWSQFGDQLEAA